MACDSNVEVRLLPTPLTEVVLLSTETNPYLGGESAIGDALFAAGAIAEELAAGETELRRSVVITLLSDGHSSYGRDPLSVAQEMKDRLANRLDIVSIAYGTSADEETLMRMASDPERGFHSTDSVERLRGFLESSIVENNRSV